MTKTLDDCAKRRLIDRRELEFAIRFMCQRGVELDDVPVQLARYYYVDIDEVNAIITELENGQVHMAEPREIANTHTLKVA
jgi:ribosomal protein S24E